MKRLTNIFTLLSLLISVNLYGQGSGTGVRADELDSILTFTDDMYVWIYDPNTSPQSHRFTYWRLSQQFQNASGNLNGLSGVSSNGFLVRTGASTAAARTLTGTTDRLTITNGSGVGGNPTFDISTNYAGQLSINTLGTVTTGTWNAAVISDSYLDKSGDWTGVFDGQEGSYYLDRSNHSGILSVAAGGSGVSSFTPYAPVFGGTIAGGPLQSGTVGSSGQVLTSNGASALPTYQDLPTPSPSVGSQYNVNVSDGSSGFEASTISINGSDISNTAGAIVNFNDQVDATGFFTTGQIDIGTQLYVGQSQYIVERAAATPDLAGYGQLYVKNNTPNVLIFRDDAGNEYDLTVGGGGGFVVTGTTDNGLITFNNATGEGVVESNALFDGSVLTVGSNSLTSSSYTNTNATSGSQMAINTSTSGDVNISPYIETTNGQFDMTLTIDATDDSGSTPVWKTTIQDDGGGAATVIRPLWLLENGTTDIFQVAASGDWDFKANNLTGIASATITGRTTFGSGSTGEVLVEISNETISDSQERAYWTYATHNSQSRAAGISVATHVGITNAVGYLFLDAEDNAGNYIWPDNSDVLRISTSNTHIGTTSGTVVGDQTSDERLKDNIRPVPYGLEEVLKLKPIQYEKDGLTEIGFGAQTTDPIIDEAAYYTGEKIFGENEPSKMAMDYTRIIPVLVKAMQEQQLQIANLEKKLRALEGN